MKRQYETEKKELLKVFRKLEMYYNLFINQ